MKTPREILLQRHASAQPRLDAIREQVVTDQIAPSAARTDESDSFARRLVRDLAGKMWRELIWPCRRAWCGLGAAWVVILTLNSFTAESELAAKSDSAPQFQALLRFWQEQHRLAAELGEPFPSPTEADPSLRPGPRSDRKPIQTFLLL